jgi:hypothetical protein
MNLKTKLLLICLSSLLLLLLPFYLSKINELSNCFEKISDLEYQITASDYYQIDYLKMHASISRSYYNNSFLIKDVLGDKSDMLVYRFSKNICESCLHDDLKEMEILQQEIGKDRLLLLPSYPNDRNGKIELSNLLSKFSYINLPMDFLIIPSQEGDFQQRYFALIDKDRNLTMVYFPRNENKGLTQIYLSEVKKMYKK